MGLTPEQRREIEDLVVGVVRRDNRKRAGSADDRDRRVSPPGTVTPDQHEENGVDSRALAGVPNDNTGNDNHRSTGREHQKDNSTTSRIIGSSQVLRINIGPGAAGTAEIGTNAVTEGKMENSMTGEPSAGGPSQANKGLRRIAGTGGAVSAAASNHTHSISFKSLTRGIRLGLLTLRGSIRTGRERALEERVRDLEDMVLSLCHLAFDDETYRAEERERLLTEQSEDGRRFRNEHLREQKHDFGHREMKLEDRRGFRREPHPDLPDAERPIPAQQSFRKDLRGG